MILPASDFTSSGRLTVLVVPVQGGALPRLLAGLVSAAGLQGAGGLPAAADTHSLLRLPDGRLIAALSTGGLSCSRDDGATWSTTC